MEFSLHWCKSSTADPPESVPSDNFIAACPFVPEIRRAPHPLWPLLHIHPSLHVLRHCFQVAHRRPRRQGGSQAHCASKRVDLDAGAEVHEGRARGRLLVPLAGQALGFLLLFQLIQNFPEKGTKQAGHLLHLWLVGLQDLPEPEQEETGSKTNNQAEERRSKRLILQGAMSLRWKKPQRGAQVCTLQKNMEQKKLMKWRNNVVPPVNPQAAEC